MAPEVMLGHNHTFVIDYFALGIICYELLIGRRPYTGRNRKEIKEKLLTKQAYIDYNNISYNFSAESADFTNKLLIRKPNLRLGYEGIQQIKAHPWLKDINWTNLVNKTINSPFIPKKESNFDKKHCNAHDKIGYETASRYESYMKDSNLKQIFKNFTYINNNCLTKNYNSSYKYKEIYKRKNNQNINPNNSEISNYNVLSNIVNKANLNNISNKYLLYLNKVKSITENKKNKSSLNSINTTENSTNFNKLKILDYSNKTKSKSIIDNKMFKYKCLKLNNLNKINKKSIFEYEYKENHKNSINKLNNIFKYKDKAINNKIKSNSVDFKYENKYNYKFTENYNCKLILNKVKSLNNFYDSKIDRLKNLSIYSIDDNSYSTIKTNLNYYKKNIEYCNHTSKLSNKRQTLNSSINDKNLKYKSINNLTNKLDLNAYIKPSSVGNLERKNLSHSKYNYIKPNSQISIKSNSNITKLKKNENINIISNYNINKKYTKPKLLLKTKNEYNNNLYNKFKSKHILN